MDGLGALTIRDAGVRPTDPPAVEAEDDIAILILVFGRHNDKGKGAQEKQTPGQAALRSIREARLGKKTRGSCAASRT